MSILDAFWCSKENQEKYGFKYKKDARGIVSIFYDGDDFDELMRIASKSVGLTTTVVESDIEDTRALLEVAITETGKLVRKDTREEIEADVDGEGTEPNFYIRFTYNGEETIIRFNMLFPELYPNNEAYPYRFSLKSLSAINTLFKNRFEEFAAKWTSFHPDEDSDLRRLPNYRAINCL